MQFIMEDLVYGEIGAVYTEYALLAFLIAAVAVGAVTLFGENVLALFESFPLSIFE